MLELDTNYLVHEDQLSAFLFAVGIESAECSVNQMFELVGGGVLEVNTVGSRPTVSGSHHCLVRKFEHLAKTPVYDLIKHG